MNLISYIKKSLQDRQLNFQRNAAVERGDFLYYIISEGTNLLNRTEDGEIVIYLYREIAEEECKWEEEVISISEYNRIYERFME